MTPRRDPEPWVLLALVLVMVGLAAVPQCPARAEDGIASAIASTHSGTQSRPVDPRDAIVLARICVSECGWQPGPECAAIHEVLVDRARALETTFRGAACSYSSRSCRRSRTDGRRWIAWLDPTGMRPRGWPQGSSWQRHRPLWFGALELAGDVLRGDVESPCRGDVHHWGDLHTDLRRALRYGWERVECDGVRNAYWRVPRRPT